MRLTRSSSSYDGESNAKSPRMRRGCRACGAALAAALGMATLGCGGGRTAGAEDCSPTLYPAAGGVSDGVLRDVDLSDAGEVWAVGGAPYFDEESSVALRWDGETWSRIPSPSDIWYYQAVAVVGSNDVWAVGRTGKSFGEARVTHWDGEAWSEPALPAADEAYTTSITAPAADDVWVGGATGGAFGPARPYLAHWDGNAWTAAPLKEPVPIGVVSGLSAVASNDVWGIVEIADETTGEALPSLVIHWDGREWAAVPGPGAYELGLLTTVGPNDLWVATRQTLHRWNGRRWIKVRLPYRGLYLDGLDQAGGSIWIAATDLTGTGVDEREVVARYDGSRWTQAALPEATLGPDYRGVAAVSDRSAWAIGVQHPARAPTTQLTCID